MGGIARQGQRRYRGRPAAGASGGGQRGCRRRLWIPMRGAQGKEGAEIAWIETMSSSGKTVTGVELGS